MLDPGSPPGTNLQSITADPRTAGTGYAVWDRGRFPSDSSRNPGTSSAFRGDPFFSKTTDGGSDGNLYVVSEDNRFSGGDHIRVNQSPSGITAFTPAVDVLPNGTLAVTYYDWRHNTPDPATLPTDRFVVVSHNGVQTNSGNAANRTDVVSATVTREPSRRPGLAQGRVSCAGSQTYTWASWRAIGPDRGPARAWPGCWSQVHRPNKEGQCPFAASAVLAMPPYPCDDSHAGARWCSLSRCPAR